MGDEKMFLINLCGCDYEIDTNISFGDFVNIKRAMQDSTTDYQKVFASLICDKIRDETKPDINDIYIDKNLKICAETFVTKDSKVKELFDTKRESISLYEAVISSIYEKHNEELRKIADGFPKIDSEVLEGISALTNSFREMVVNIVTSPIIEGIAKMTSLVSETLGSIAVSIGEMFQSINVPSISDERKEEIRSAYKTWGSYGWTTMPDLPLYGFSECPIDIREANNLALSYCKKRDIEALFDSLRDIKIVKTTDLEEAIFDFQHGRYKSCALILFSLIDAKLIRLQPRDKNPKGKYRAVGKNAAEIVMNNIKNEQDLERRFLLLLDYENLFACLNTVFAKGEDFRKQPIVINRNFLAHGMMTRKVIRKDCVQLFLLYYNLLMFLEATTISKKMDKREYSSGMSNL